MRIRLNFNGENTNTPVRSRDRKLMNKIMLYFTLFLPVILCFQMSALFMELPPRDIQYVEGTMFETNYYTKYRRHRGSQIAGLRAEIITAGENSLAGFYLPLYAIEGDAEVLRDKINHPRSQKCRIGYVAGVEDRLTVKREDRYIISLECEGELLVTPESTVNAYRARAEERLLTAVVWLAMWLIIWLYSRGLIQIQWYKD